MEKVVVVSPIDSDEEEAEEIAEEDGDKWEEFGPFGTGRHFEVEDHDGDDDGEYAVAEGFEAVFVHSAFWMSLMCF